ncbi:manganese-binding transcriptional regulator MntR [Halocynthiibacter styelae]|uniref:Transcriptional regulator MntR n=1 Tax=Halocynthiibacter styelae TaxID=2761955 RepID=A0A8J7J8M7_9RHOB|nr:manganese-binding transcriptional regulator MntR [Paenihalocynthiibacter styelae]MBI1495435.1 manganese-binding transcriptional regulator MntR [Paenihalocynthiibacter styelae]
MTNPPFNSAPRSVQEQVRQFESVRTAHQSEMVEDYVELIADLIHLTGSARPKDIAERFGVAQPTVTKNLARLKREKLILHEPYRSIQLTEEGRQLASSCRKRHRTVVEFLIALGISPSVAEHDAEGIEHHVSDETLRVFRAFTHDKKP